MSSLPTYTGATNYVSLLEDKPSDTGVTPLTAAQVKAVMDQFGTEFKAWFNATFVVAGYSKAEVDVIAANFALGVISDGSITTVKMADITTQVPYGGATTGLANTYVLAAPAIAALTAGMAVSCKINVDSTGASTLNWNSKGAKAIKKANGTDVTNLKNGGIYTLRYDGTNFIVQGEGGSGDAIASDLLSGKTASTDVADITGTMPNNAGDVAAVSSHAASTSIHVVPATGYTDGTDDAVVITDADFIAANIKKAKDVFGVTGVCKEGYYATGTVTVSSSTLTVTGLTFSPNDIVIAVQGAYRKILLPITSETFTLDASGHYTVGSIDGFNQITATGFTCQVPAQTGDFTYYAYGMDT